MLYHLIKLSALQINYLYLNLRFYPKSPYDPLRNAHDTIQNEAILQEANLQGRQVGEDLAQIVLAAQRDLLEYMSILILRRHAAAQAQVSAQMTAQAAGSSSGLRGFSCSIC